MADYSQLSDELTKKIADSYNAYVRNDKSIKGLEMLKNPTQADAIEYSWKQGEALVRAVKDNVSADILPDGTLYREIGSKILPPNLAKCSDHVADYAVSVMKRMDEDAGYHMLTIKPKQDVSRINGIVEMASKRPYNEVQEQLYETLTNYTAHTVDEAVRLNAEMRDKLGLKTVVTRIYDGVGLHDGKQACDWCLSRAGTWSYQDAVANGVFERHTGCGCEITYTTEGHTDFMKAEEKFNSKTGKFEKTKKWISD